MGFGTGIVPSGWGFSLQNRGHNFSLDANHPNALAPGKRPYHTIIPGLITYANPKSDPANPLEDLYAPFGVMGGFMQPQGHMQVVSALVDDSLDPQAVLDQPRFRIYDAENEGKVALEDGISLEVQAELAKMGHQVYSVGGYERSVFGRGQIIHRDLGTGVLCGGSDPRSDGCVMTL